jgi:hypothetical protein
MENQTNTQPKKIRLKIVAAVGLLILVIGAILFSVGMSAAGWDFKKLDREQLTAAEFTTESAVDTVTLDGGWNYEVVRGESVRIDYFTSNLSDVSVTEATNPNTGKSALTLAEHSDRPWFYWVGLVNGVARMDAKVVVTITEDVTLKVNGASVGLTAADQNFNAVTVEGSSADLNLTNVRIAGDLSVDGASADVNLKNVTAAKVNLKGSSLDLDYEGGEAGSVTLNGSSLDADMTGVAVAGQLYADGSSIHVTMENSSVREVRLDGSSADFDGKNIDLYALYAHGSSVDARLQLVGSLTDIQTVRADGSSASVRVDVNGNGAFESGERFRDNAVYTGSGYKSITADGSSAKIELTFAGGESQFTA